MDMEEEEHLVEIGGALLEALELAELLARARLLVLLLLLLRQLPLASLLAVKTVHHQLLQPVQVLQALLVLLLDQRDVLTL